MKAEIIRSSPTVTLAPAQRRNLAVAVGAGGLVLTGVVGYVLTVMVGVVLNALVLAGLAVIGFALVTFLPAIVLALRVGAMRAEEAIVRANPIETLELHRKAFAQTIEDTKDKVDRAYAALSSYKLKFESSRKHLSADSIAKYEARLGEREAAIKKAEGVITTLRGQQRELDTQIEQAKAELAMAEADNEIASAIGSLEGNPDQARRSSTAFDAVARIVAEAESNARRAMSELDALEGAKK